MKISEFVEQIICAGNAFAYSPRSHTRGRAGESSPALLCRRITLETSDLLRGEAHAPAKEGGFQFARLAPAAPSNVVPFVNGSPQAGSLAHAGAA